MKKKKRVHARAGSLIMAAALVLSGTGGTIVANAADSQIRVRSQSQTQMSSEPELVYNNEYKDTTIRTQNFDSNWKFYLGEAGDAQVPIFDDSKWRQLSLPHDYSIEQEFSQSMEAESGYLPGGTGWYRKRFTVGEEMKGKELRIDFGGVYMNATVYVNGEKLGTHPFGYTPFSFDITDHVNFGGENVIAVKVEHRTPSSRWYSGSGIYRSVNLTVMDKVHVDLYGTKIETPNLESEAGGNVNMDVATTVANESDAPQSVVLTHTVYEKGTETNIGTATTEAIEIPAGETAVIDADVTAANPTLWDLQNPQLYTVRTEVKIDNKVVDTYDTEYGFRYISMDTKTGFYLNGNPVKLKGVCMHHDQGALGAAAYRRAIERQVEILQEMGCNSIRVTHNPAANELIEICNEKGILVIDEFFDGWMHPKNGNSQDYSLYFEEEIEADNTILGSASGMTWAEFDLKSTVHRGKNAPSVIMWSLGNEIQEGASGDGYSAMADNLIQWTQEVDQTKLITIGSNAVKNGAPDHVEIANKITAVGGASGTNYSGGGSYDDLHQKYPDWFLYGSETASSVNSRGIYNTKSNNSLNADKQLTSYDKSAVSWGAFASAAWYDVITRDFVAGEYVWTGFDYIGEPTPKNGTYPGAQTAWPSPKNSFFGIVDTAGLPKDSYYFYQSQWNEDVNTLHVLPAWNEDVVMKNGNNVEVVVYSDAASVELFLNERSLGEKAFVKKTTPAGYTYQVCEGQESHQNLYMTWNVPFEAGELKAVAYDENGNVIEETEGRSVVRTTGDEAKLTASADRTEIKADGKDLSYITVDVRDKDGNIVPDADDRVTFEVEGDGMLVGVDNGSSPDHDSYKADNRKAFSGSLVAIVQSTKKAGNITVTATAKGLESATVEITTTPVSAGTAEKQIDSVLMSKNYYVKSGNMPELPNQLETRYNDGTIAMENVTWDPIDESLLQETGSFTVNGLVGDYAVSVVINIIDDIGGLLNYSAVTSVGTAPVLPETRQAVMPDGTILATAFEVDWEEMPEDTWNTASDEPVEVQGTANVLGQEIVVTASIRVAEQTVTLGNSVSGAAYLSQSVPEGKQDDTLEAIKDGKTEIVFPNSGPNQTAWSNWTVSQEGETKSEITFRYDTQQVIGQINIWFAKDNASMRYPDAGKTEIWISETGGEEEGSWTKVDVRESFTPKNEIGVNKYTYEFSPFGATFVKFKLTNAIGEAGMSRKPCTGITEIELLSAQSELVTNTTADLEKLVVNGTEVSASDLAAGSYATPALVAEVHAKGADNAAVTVTPANENRIYVIIESEDHKTRNTFEIRLGEETVLTPDNDSKDHPIEGLTAIAGSVYPGGGNEGPANLVLDGNPQTHWHTHYNTAEGQDMEKRWIGLEFAEAALVDGLRYLPRQAGGSNGAVTTYRIEYLPEGSDNWADAVILAEGTWDVADTGWKLVQFEPVEAKKIRLVGVHTFADSGNDAHMSAAELRATVPEEKVDISDTANQVTAVIDPDTIEVSRVDEAHPVEPEVTVTKEGEPLQYGIDYVIRYENNTAVGEATAIVKGIIDYTGEISVPFTIVQTEKELETITVKQNPQLIYAEGELFNPAGLILNLNYSDGSVEEVAYGEDTQDAFTFAPSLDTALTQDMTDVQITYAEKTTTLKITVTEKVAVTVTGISVKTLPKTEYKAGEPLNVEGLTLEVTYSDNSVKEVVYGAETAEQFAFDPAAGTELAVGTTSIKVTYEGKETSYSITVKKDDVPVDPDPEKPDEIREKVQTYYDECLAFYKAENYKDSPKEWAAYEKAMNELKAVLDDPDATADELMAASDRVAKAAKALKVDEDKEESDDSKKPTPPEETVKTGDSNVMLPVLAALIIAVAAIVVVLARRRKL